MRPDPVEEGGRWLRQDRHYIPTRYPNGLPGGIPAEAFDADDAEKAMRQAQLIIQQVAEFLEGTGEEDSV